MKKKGWLLVCLYAFNLCNANTLVYNLKIRRAFDIPEGLFTQTRPLWIASAVPIIYQRDRHILVPELFTDIHETRLTTGALLNLRYKPSRHWWFEASTGIEKERACAVGTTNLHLSRTGFDDFLFSGGYIGFPQENTQVVAYGLFGIPSKWEIGAQERILTDTLVGTRFFSIGTGLESSHAFMNELENSLVGVFQARFIHFFSRSLRPSVACGNFLHPGNVIDALFLVQYRQKMTLFEAGYNPTFFTNQAVTASCVKTETPNFVRQGATFSCTHLFKDMLFDRMPLIIGTGVNFSHSKRFDTKILSAWLNFTTVF